MEGGKGSRNRLGAAPPTVLGEQTAPPSAAFQLPSSAAGKEHRSCPASLVPSLSWDGATTPFRAQGTVPKVQVVGVQLGNAESQRVWTGRRALGRLCVEGKWLCGSR